MNEQRKNVCLTKGRAVLVVGKPSSLRDTVAIFLASLEIEATMAEDPQAALRALHETRFDAIVTSFFEAGIDGGCFYEEAVKQFPKLGRGFIFVTDKRGILRSQLNGCRILTPPFDGHDLAKALLDVFDPLLRKNAATNACGNPNAPTPRPGTLNAIRLK